MPRGPAKTPPPRIGEPRALDPDGLPPIRDITRITYNPDDVIVVRCVGRRINSEVARVVKEHMRAAFPVQEILVTDEDWVIDVITPAEQAPT